MITDLIQLLLPVLILLVAVILAWFAEGLIDWLLHRVTRRTETSLDDRLIRALAGPLRPLILLIGIELTLLRVEQIPDSWWDTLNRIFFVLYLILIYAAVYRLISAFAGWYDDEVVSKTETDLDDRFLTFFRYMALIIVSTIAIVILLGEFGIEPTALVTTLGIGSLAIALAAQATLGDMIAGFMIMIDQPFRVGDRIELLDIDTWGDVTSIGLRSTRILTRDNRQVSVPNSVIGEGLVVNYSIPNTVYRVETHVGLAYGTDIEEARQVMIEAIRAEDWVMKERPIEALLLEFADSALLFRVRCWIEHYVETRRVIDKMNSALYKALASAEMTIPFPQRDVHLISTAVTAENKPSSGAG